MRPQWSRFPSAVAALAVAATLAATLIAAPAADAAEPRSRSGVEVVIDVSEQSMRVYERGRRIAIWPVSTGRRGYRTPRGSFRPTWLSRNHRSRKYNNAPMPFSVFFHGGYAIHGTDAVARLGRPASHGCVRLAPRNARRLFDLVRRYGEGGVRIRIRN